MQVLLDSPTENARTSASGIYRYRHSRWGYDATRSRAPTDGILAEEPVSAKVGRMLAETGLTLNKPRQLESMVIVINRLEGVHQDDTNRGLALLVREGKLTNREAMLLAVTHSKQR